MVFSIDSFTEDQVEYYPLTGLSCSSNRNAPAGFICLCKTRAGNSAFWKWYLTEIFIPETQRCRNRSFSLQQFPDGSLMPIFIMIDGEAVQLEQIFDLEVLRLLEEKTI